MATNIKQGGNNRPICRLGVVTTFPASPVANDPVLFGELPGVAETTMDATTSLTTVELDCIAELVVQGVNGSGNSAVTAGEIVYASKASPVVLSKIATGVRFGIAYGNALSDNSADTRTGQLVASGNTTTTIRVLVGH